MKVIHRIEDTEIYKADTNTYAILTRNSNDNLAGFLEIIDVKYEVESSTEIKITGSSVKTLEQFLSDSKKLIDYNTATKMTLDLVRQILYLEENEKTLSFLTPQDIIIIDNSKFLILNQTNIYEINRDHIEITTPYNVSDFMPPTMVNNRSLPLKLYYTEVYYCIGKLLIYCLYNSKIDQDTDLRLLLGSIYSTRLYWFIVKCLINDARQRQLMFF
jgi:hypothetical protein